MLRCWQRGELQASLQDPGPRLPLQQDATAQPTFMRLIILYMTPTAGGDLSALLSCIDDDLQTVDSVGQSIQDK